MPTPADPNYSKARAYEAKLLVARVRNKSGSGKTLRRVHMYPELVKLRQQGWTIRHMAQYIGEAGGPTTTRAYEKILAEEGAKLLPVERRSAELPPDIQAMRQWTPEAFFEFHRRYSPYGEVPTHKKSWVRAFIREKNLLLNVPPGHGKSELFMIWIPLWLIARDRDVQILMVSNADTDAAHWALEVAGHLEHNEKLIADWGRFAPESVGDQKWTPGSGLFSVIGRERKIMGGQFTMESRGMTGRVLGRRADFVIVDDPTKQEDAESPATRQRTLNHLQQQVFSRAEPEGEFNGGRIVVIGQRVHLLDCYGSLEKQEWPRGPNKGQKVWHVEKYPAVLDWDKKKTLWPERWDWEEIEMAHARVGSWAAFSCMYQQEPMPEGTAMFDPRVLESCKDFARPAFEGFRRVQGEEYLPVVRVVSIDPSPTKYHGIVVGDLIADKDNFAFAITEIHRVDPGVDLMKREVDKIINACHPDYLIFEESGFLAWFRDDPWFRELRSRVHYVGHHTGANKNTMEYGVQSLAGDFEFKRISFPYGDPEGKRMTDLLISEAVIYPFDDTYDTLMALWFVKFNYKDLRPRVARPGHIQTKRKIAKTYAFMNQLRNRKNQEEEAMKRYREQRARERQEAMSG